MAPKKFVLLTKSIAGEEFSNALLNSLLKSADRHLCNYFCNLVYNIAVVGVFYLTSSEKNFFRRNKSTVAQLATKSIGLDQRKKTLSSNSVFIRRLCKIYDRYSSD